MQKQTAKIFGVLVALLAVLGFVTNSPTFGFINTDNMLDFVRLALAAALLYAGFKSSDETIVQGILVFVGVLFIGIGFLGLLSSTLWALLPNGLTGFDILLHLLVGVVAVLAGLKTSTVRT